MDARSQLSWLIALLVALTTSLPLHSQTLKPSAARQPYTGPFSVNRGSADVSGIVTGLTPVQQTTPVFNVPGTASSFELIPVMPMSLHELPQSNSVVATRKTYNLGDLSDNPELSAWVAEMIPKVVQPGTWHTDGPNSRVFSYFAPAKMLLVYHTPSAHAEIDEFLQSVKKSLPQNRSAILPSRPRLLSDVRQAQHAIVEPRLAPNGSPSSNTAAYPVPIQSRQPRHLFHFIIRYEGDGVIDSNIVEFAKAYSKENSSADETPSVGSELAVAMPPSGPIPYILPAHTLPIVNAPLPHPPVPPMPHRPVVPVGASQAVGVPTTVAPPAPRPIAPPAPQANPNADW